jgi:hypothetical protein
VISDSSRSIILTATKKLSVMDTLQGEAHAALLASRLAIMSGFGNFSLEGDALLVILAINSPSLFSIWNISNIVSDISLGLFSSQSWNALKVSCSVNFYAHTLAKYAAFHLVFESIPIRSSILLSIRIKSEKDSSL